VIAVSGICTAVTAAAAAAGTVVGVETVGNRIEDAGIGMGVSTTGAFFAASAAVAAVAAAVTGDGITSGAASGVEASGLAATAAGFTDDPVGVESRAGVVMGAKMGVSTKPIAAPVPAPALVVAEDATGEGASDALPADGCVAAAAAAV
jgi:hypothetical protein